MKIRKLFKSVSEQIDDHNQQQNYWWWILNLKERLDEHNEIK